MYPSIYQILLAQFYTHEIELWTLTLSFYIKPFIQREYNWCKIRMLLHEHKFGVLHFYKIWIQNLQLKAFRHRNNHPSLQEMRAVFYLGCLEHLVYKTFSRFPRNLTMQMVRFPVDKRSKFTKDEWGQPVLVQ